MIPPKFDPPDNRGQRNAKVVQQEKDNAVGKLRAERHHNQDRVFLVIDRQASICQPERKYFVFEAAEDALTKAKNIAPDQEVLVNALQLGNGPTNRTIFSRCFKRGRLNEVAAVELVVLPIAGIVHGAKCSCYGCDCSCECTQCEDRRATRRD